MRVSLILLTLAFAASGCKVLYPSEMFKVPKDMGYTDFDSLGVETYRIAVGDELEVYVASNNDYGTVIPLIGSFQTGGAGRQGQANTSYLVEQNGEVLLPIIGPQKLLGMSTIEARDHLAAEYSKYFEQATAYIRVANKEVYLFRGLDGATPIRLERDNMTLLEVLASAGGIGRETKAHSILLIRGDIDNPMVDHIDLSELHSMGKGDLVMQAGDIIYVRPKFRIVNDLLKELSPYLALITTATTTYLLINSLQSP